uniref:Pleckstrin homology domain containing, family A member 7a n=1 Tax=Hucho hucho TaxID=62062 RepID=A0A4W5L4P7_9TELE
MAAPLGRETLPEHWSYGVCGDGRVFFVHDETNTTAWLHPQTGEPVNSGHMIRSDLPRGWEEGFTDEGVSYFINHNQRTTTFRHPVTGQVSQENVGFILQEQPGGRMSNPQQADLRPSSTISEASTAVTTSTVDTTSGSKDRSGMRLWKRKWFVLADYCLFYYKDSREESVLGSIPLPSYVISAVEPEDHISRKYAFKAEHGGMRTYFFSADTQEDMNGWVKAMNQAALMQNQTDSLKRPSETSEKPEMPNTSERKGVPQTNHVNNYTKTSREPRADLHLHSDGVVLEPADIRETEERCNSASAPTSAPPSRAPSRAPSRGTSTLPPGACLRNGTPNPEPNGMGTGTYQRATLPPQVVDTHRQVQRRSALEQVEHWVKVQKAEHKGPPSRGGTLPRHSPQTQPKFIGLEAYQTLPKTPRRSPPTAARQGEYKYAQDRLSHFRLGPSDPQGTGARDGGGIGGPGTVWQLYEWQQRHQFRHGSPTAPLYTPAPDYPFGPRPPSTVPPSAPRPSSEVPRCVSVPPDPSDILPPGPPGSRALSPPRRPHTPANRVVVMPRGERDALDVPVAGSPRRAATIERRSMPPSNYITHTVSAPSLHGKTVDDTYMQLKKDLEYLDLKVGTLSLLLFPFFPPPHFSSSSPVKLSRLCEQDKTLKELEVRICSLKDDKDKLESVLDVSHQQMELYRDQAAHLEKIAYQQRLLQEDVVHIRAEISSASTEMARAWEDYSRLESSVEQLRAVLQAHMNHSATPQEKTEIKRELWRIEDVMAGLSSSKANYKITIDSVQNPERKLVASVSDPAVPSQSATPPVGEVRPPPRSSYTLPHNPVPKWAEDEAPPRPPLPRLYDYEDPPPAIPPLPKEASVVVRHTSVRGLKRQSDERKRDRESGGCVNGDFKVELRPYLSEPELPGTGQSGTGPKSALEQLYSSGQQPQPPPQAPRGRMSAEEQLERMKRHQRALVRERKRNLSQGERHSNTTHRASSTRALSSTDLGSLKERERIQSDEWLTVMATPMREMDMEPLDYDLDLSRELSKPQKVSIPERYVESDPEEPLSQEEMEDRQRRAERIKNILNIHPSSGASVPLNFTDLDIAMQQQERIMTVSHALASEASVKSKQFTGQLIHARVLKHTHCKYAYCPVHTLIGDSM